MIEIAAHRHLPIVTLLSIALACVIAAVLIRWSTTPRVRPRVYGRAIAVGVLCAVASGALWSRRHAGTGTETAWGWPRVIYREWVSWEVAERRAGVRWQGLVENAVFYGAAAALVATVVVATRGRAARGAG